MGVVVGVGGLVGGVFCGFGGWVVGGIFCGGRVLGWVGVLLGGVGVWGVGGGVVTCGVCVYG